MMCRIGKEGPAVQNPSKSVSVIRGFHGKLYDDFLQVSFVRSTFSAQSIHYPVHVNNNGSVEN